MIRLEVDAYLNALRLGVVQACQILAARERRELLASTRYHEHGRLPRHGYQVFSQDHEDGMIAEIFRRIGITTSTFLEIGVDGGLENNTRCLLSGNWRGMWLEGNPDNVKQVNNLLSTLIDAGKLTCLQERVTHDNINEICARSGLTGEIDFLSIDVDGQDYWLWNALEALNPRVVCIEYNGQIPPSNAWVEPPDSEARWDGTNMYGAGLYALELLAAKKGYCLVGCTLSGVNAFFVRSDLTGNEFCSPFTAENHYEPARYYLVVPNGHPRGHRSLMDVSS